MKRPLVLYTISIISGTIAASLTPIPVLAAVVMLFAVAGALFYRANRTWSYIFLSVFAFCMLGAANFYYRDLIVLQRLDRYSGQTVALKGVVLTEPDTSGDRTRFTLAVNSLQHEGAVHKVSGKVKVTLNAYEKGRVPAWRDIVELEGRLDRPQGARNPGGFSQRRNLAISGIGAVMFCNGGISVAGRDNPGLPLRIGMGIRQRVVRTVEGSLPPQQASLLNGMLIGYTDGLEEGVKAAFSDAGLSHIMAVSGANLVFIMLPFIFLFKKFKLGQRITNILLIAVVCIFVLVTGFSPSVARAAIMAVTMLSAKLLKRDTDVYTSIAFSALLLTAVNPFTVFDIGFQLSYAATLSLVMFSKTIKTAINFKFIPELIADAAAVTLAAQVGVLPVTAYYFNKVSVISLISNLAAVPALEAVTVGGMVLAAAGQISCAAADAAGFVVSPFLTALLYISKYSASAPFAVMKIATPSIMVITLYYIAAVLIFKIMPDFRIRPGRKKVTAAVCTVIFIGFVSTQIPRSLTITFIDVGQGDSALIKTPYGATVLIDGGVEKAGKSAVVPLLLDMGVTKPDIIVTTHAHDDHMQGLLTVISELGAGKLILPDTEDKEPLGSVIDAANKKKTEVSLCGAGSRIQLDKRTSIDIMNPPEGGKYDKGTLNNSSLVLKLNYRKVSVLFTGDMEEDVERELIARKNDLKANVLKVGHHGSITSTCTEFLDMVKPDAAVISVGYNSFGHPSPEILERLAGKSVKLYRTDKDGGVILKTDGRKIRISGTIN